MRSRFTQEHLETWRRDGALLIPNFFTAEETAAVQADFEAVFGRNAGAEAALDRSQAGELGRFHPKQFENIQAIPLDCSPAMNLVGLHPELMAFARAALGTDEVALYQCQAWAKFTGDADYNQPFHCDFANHTLTAPSEDPSRNSVTYILIFSDVTEAHGPTHYVTKADSLPITGPEATFSNDPALQEKLAALARSAAGPAGSLFIYGIDVWHRGTNLIAPSGHRYVMTVTYKNARDPAIGYHAWPFHHRKPWRLIFEHATPDQLSAFGVQPPGHAFWTEETIRRAQARYPGWDMTPYRKALKTPVTRSKAGAELQVQP